MTKKITLRPIRVNHGLIMRKGGVHSKPTKSIRPQTKVLIKRVGLD